MDYKNYAARKWQFNDFYCRREPFCFAILHSPNAMQKHALNKQLRRKTVEKYTKNKKKIYELIERCISLRLVSSWWTSFSVALSAIYWSCAVWLERNITFFSAVSASCLVHLSVTV
jgi:hypothetical protein